MSPGRDPLDVNLERLKAWSRGKSLGADATPGAKSTERSGTGERDSELDPFTKFLQRLGLR